MMTPKKTKPGMLRDASETKEKIRSGEIKLEFGWTETSIAGLYQIEAKQVKAVSIYGWAWFRHETGNVISISESYVRPFLRRCGLRTAMHNQLLEWFPETRMIVTGGATDDSFPWLKKMGFVFNKEMDRWELNIKSSRK